MNSHVVPIKRALEEFCRAYATDGETWQIDVYPSGLAESVHAVIVHPAFTRMDIMERQERISEFLEDHLAVEHRVNLMLRRALTPDEYEEMQAAERAAKAFALA